MSCNIAQKRCRLASSVQILGDRLQKYCNKNKLRPPNKEIDWLKIWAQVASNKLGKTFVETVHIGHLLQTAKIHAYAKAKH